MLLILSFFCTFVCVLRITCVVLLFLSHPLIISPPQAACRGRLARVRVQGIREHNRRMRAATMIQTMVRFRGARHEAAARKRQLGPSDL